MGNTRYLVNESNIYNLDYELIYITKSKFENDWHSTPHSHPFTEIFYIINGQGSFQLDENIISVKSGDLILINPNCAHTEKSSTGGKPLEYIVFGINNLSLVQNLHSGSFSDLSNPMLYRIISLTEGKKELLFFLDSLKKELENKNDNYELACKSILTLLLIFIKRNSKDNLFITDNVEKVNVECFKIKSYIDSHYSENITLDFLANLTYINKFHLVHLFTKQMGISPINYLINKRIEESKNLLKTTDYSIRDISSIVGFSNSSYFSQMFKKVTGHSPKMFRSIENISVLSY